MTDIEENSAQAEHVGLVPLAIVAALMIAGLLWLTTRHLRRADVA